MAFRDFENNLRDDQVVDPAAATVDADGASVDMKDYNSVAFYALVGATGDTLDADNYILLELEDSADNSSFANVADADMTNSVTGATVGTFAKINAAAEDDAVYMTEYHGGARYVRPVINVVGTHTNGTPIGILALRAGAGRLPVTQA